MQKFSTEIKRERKQQKQPQDTDQMSPRAI